MIAKGLGGGGGGRRFQGKENILKSTVGIVA